MKSFWLIFSIYILILSVLPCTDKEECGEPAQTSISKNTNHDTHEHENEHCSPFCICACCGTSIGISYPSMFQVKEQKVIFSPVSFTIYNEHITSNFFGNIWQPPKIC